MSTVTTIAVPALVVLWLVGAVAWWSVTGLNSARFRRLIRSARPHCRNCANSLNAWCIVWGC